MHKRNRILALGLTAAALAAYQTGCNMFEWMDAPVGDAQLKSAGDACLDEGDFECAIEYYGEMSDENKDLRLSRQALALLNKAGVSMADIIDAFLSGGPDGKAFTRLANGMVADAGAAKRAEIYDAFEKVGEISDATLRGFTRFLTATALAAEILAEEAGTDGQFTTADLATDAATCSANNSACPIAGDASCTPPAGSNFGNNPATTYDYDTAEPTGTADLAMFNEAIAQVLVATGASEMGSGGSFATTSSTADTVNTAGTTLTTTQTRECYILTLLQNNFGSTQ